MLNPKEHIEVLLESAMCAAEMEMETFAAAATESSFDSPKWQELLDNYYAARRCVDFFGELFDDRR